MKPPEEVKAEFVRQWLGKASEDLRVCRRLPTETAFLLVKGFHAQQAVEKGLKAFLVWHQIEFSKSHDVRRILELVASADPELAAKLTAAQDLNPHAVQYRYPSDLPEPTVDDIGAAIATAERVVDEVPARLPRELREALQME